MPWSCSCTDRKSMDKSVCMILFSVVCVWYLCLRKFHLQFCSEPTEKYGILQWAHHEKRAFSHSFGCLCVWTNIGAVGVAIQRMVVCVFQKNQINCVRANSLNFFVCIIQFQMRCLYLARYKIIWYIYTEKANFSAILCDAQNHLITIDDSFVWV